MYSFGIKEILLLATISCKLYLNLLKLTWKGKILFYQKYSHHIVNLTFIISLLMTPQLGHRPSLYITYKEKGPKPTTGAQCGLVGANDCKCSRDQRLNVPSEARRYEIIYFWSPIQWPTLLNFRDSMPKRTDRRTMELLLELCINQNKP
jgi:hypothetical protein